MNRLLTVVLLLYQVLALAGAAVAEDYTFLTQWGDQRPALWTQLSKPRGVAVVANSEVVANGTVYVSATLQNSVFKYSPAGSLLASWSLCDGTFLNYPMEMVFVGNELYVADTGNNRICVFNADGVYQRKIEAGFSSPVGVAVDNNRNLYVTDRGNDVVKKLNSLGTLIQTWSGFTDPWGVTIYSNSVYVTDGTLTGMVHKLDMNGNHIRSWGPRGTGPGQFLMAEGVAGFNSSLYVSDGEYGRIHVFDLNGNFQRTIGERGTGNGQLQFATALAADAANGWLYVSDDDNDRIVRFDLKTPTPTYSTQWGCDSSGTTGLRYPTKIAVDDARGVMYVVDSAHHRIRKMTLYPGVSEILTFGSYGALDGQFRYPVDAAVDSAGNVYVVDNLKRNVQKFSSNGTFIRKYDFNLPPLLTVPLKYLYGLHAIAIDSADNMYVVDAGTDAVHVLNALGNKTGAWNVNAYATGIAIDEAHGFAYVTSFFPDVATQYALNGTPTGKVIGQDAADPFMKLWHPYSIAVDLGGNLLMADTFRNRLNKFGTTGAAGNFITTIGNLNWTGDNTPGQFNFPYGVALDASGYVYAADTNNHRIQVFRSGPYNLSTASQGNGTISCPPTATYGGQQVCTITPAEGYYLSSLTDNGKHVTVALPGNVYNVTAVFSDHSLSAGFQLIQIPTVRLISGLSETPYDTVALAYSSPVKNGDIIELQPITYEVENQDLDLTIDVSFTLRGGVDFVSSAQIGHSIISPSQTSPNPLLITIREGTVTFDGIIIW